MQLKDNERIVRVVHHHPTPFVFKLLKVILAVLPFLLFIFVFQESLSEKFFIVANLVIFFIFSLIVAYTSLIYWLDKLVITNRQVVHVNWRFLSLRTESDVPIDGISDIQTRENGLFSYFRVFDYGLIRVNTDSNDFLEFDDAPDPEGLRKIIYHVRNQ